MSPHDKLILESGAVSLNLSEAAIILRKTISTASRRFKALRKKLGKPKDGIITLKEFSTDIGLSIKDCLLLMGVAWEESDRLKKY